MQLTESIKFNFLASVIAMQDIVHTNARDKGWWDEERNDGEAIALMHSELSEAMEAVRKSKQDDHLPHRPGVEVELADAVIRIMDYAGARGLDIGGAMAEKLAYNATRADHTAAARTADGGKRF